MTTTIATYPGGFIGAGLTLLRLSAAATLLSLGAAGGPGGLESWLTTALAVVLTFGAFTRSAALLGALMVGGLRLGAHDHGNLAGALGLAVLALTGAGAWSLDALTWGRVHVKVRSGRRSGG